MPQAQEEGDDEDDAEGFEDPARVDHFRTCGLWSSVARRALRRGGVAFAWSWHESCVQSSASHART